MYISVASGHHKAALAIEKALKAINPATDVLNIDSVNYTSPILGRIINRAYMSIVKNAPEVWDYLYDNPEVVKRTQKLRDFIHKFNSSKLDNLIDGFKPDAVVCTQAFPCGLVADYKKTYHRPIPLFGVLTDFMPHSYWLYDDVTNYIVPSEETKARLIQNGVAKDKIKTLGIPIDPVFTIKLNKGELYKKFRLSPQAPTILIMGGGQGLGPIKKIVKHLDKIKMPLQLLVVTGTNRRLKNQLARKHFKDKVLIYEYIENIYELMELSNLIITKPGGLTTAESLAKSLPMIIVNPIPGQETKNAEFLLSKGAALSARDEEDVAILIQRLLNNSVRLDEMSRAAASYGKPSAAADIAKLILSN